MDALTITLRPYQKDILNHADIVAILRYLEGKRELPDIIAPLVVAPTGSGKTNMMAAVARWCYDHSIRVVILVPKRKIARNTIKTLHEFGVIAGMIMAGRPMTSDIIQVATTGTIVNRLSVCKKPAIILIDEAHHSTMANTIGKITQFWPISRIGFSATPQRLDGVGLRAMFDKLIQEILDVDRKTEIKITQRWLVNQGYLAMPYVLQPPGAEGAATYHVTRGDFDEKEQETAMIDGAIMGNVIDHYRKHLDGAPTICWCVSIKHAQVMADQFNQAGYIAVAVWGDGQDDDEFDTIMDGLETGRINVVTFCDMIDEGIDVPAVSGVIMLRRTMSLTKCRQVIGRGLRPVYAPGFTLDTPEGRKAAQAAGPKPRAVILDHVGNTTSEWGHGHPLTEPEWSLDSVKRKKGEKPPATVTCPKCYGVWPGRPRTCPACGFSFQGAAIEGEKTKLTEIEGELVAAGLPENEAHGLAEFVRAAQSESAAKRQKMLLSKAFQLALDTREQEDVRKRKIAELARAVGYDPEKWVPWAWSFVQSRKAT